MRAKIFRQYDSAKDRLDFAFEYNPEETLAVHSLANRNSGVDIELLRRIALWKLNRVLEVPPATIQKLQALATADGLALRSREVRSVVEQLIGCPGIGLPMASAILKFLRPDIFPIIDVRAFRALYGKRLYWHYPATSRDINLYLRYAIAVQQVAQTLKRPLKEIDEQLYCFDEKYNGKI